MLERALRHSPTSLASVGEMLESVGEMQRDAESFLSSRTPSLLFVSMADSFAKFQPSCLSQPNPTFHIAVWVAAIKESESPVNGSSESYPVQLPSTFLIFLFFFLFFKITSSRC